MEAGLTELRALVAAARRAATAEASTSAKATADRRAPRARRLYLVSRTSHLAEGWCERVPAIELAADAGGAGLGEAVRAAGRSMGVDVVWESPADVIPLPTGWEERSLRADLSAVALAEVDAVAEVAGSAAIGDGSPSLLELRHFDPYSVVLRLVARGDEPDYVSALEYVLHGWVEPARLEGLLADIVPRMNYETLAQDPAEFRRKFKGLRQLYLRSHAVYSPGGTRAGDAVTGP